ncbi:MAG: cupin domain-containing protein [Gammaproteobacteria bacterium]|nr:cupin domain-containing protein [Gammaproteobacteria bacterium]
MSDEIQRIIDFNTLDEASGAKSAMPAERCLKGQPQQTLWNLFQDNSKQMLSGVWECSEGKWQADYSSKSEFCHILAGKIVLTDASGHESTFCAGDSFVIPSGFDGTWEVIEPVRKLYVIVTPN